MSMDRDMTKTEFDRSCASRGFRAAGYLGYYDLGLPNARASVSVLNAGRRRRDQLAYLIREREKAEKRYAPTVAQAVAAKVGALME